MSDSAKRLRGGVDEFYGLLWEFLQEAVIFPEENAGLSEMIPPLQHWTGTVVTCPEDGENRLEIDLFFNTPKTLSSVTVEPELSFDPQNSFSITKAWSCKYTSPVCAQLKDELPPGASLYFAYRGLAYDDTSLFMAM